jgi:hypothetical protein
MWKIVFILAICAVGGYLHKQGLFAQWVEQAQEGAALQIESQGAPKAAQLEEQMRRQREAFDRATAERSAKFQQEAQQPLFHPSIPGAAQMDDCARARHNVQQMQGWMSQGGTMHNVTEGKKMSENETFDALAKNRQFIESNCR